MSGCFRHLLLPVFALSLVTATVAHGESPKGNGATAKAAAKDGKEAKEAKEAKDPKAGKEAKDTKKDDPNAKAGTSKAKGTLVEIKTSEGAIKVELADKEAPITVSNFLGYVKDHFYDGTIFHRVIDGFMIQGGGFQSEGEKLTEKGTKAPIVNEGKNGLKNERGTIAMARTHDPDSATAQFFLNLVPNDALNYPSPDGFGYAVFGRVVDGMDVVDKIGKSETRVRMGMADVPKADVKIVSISVVAAGSH